MKDLRQIKPNTTKEYRLEFLDKKAIRRRITKEFNDEQHLDNFIAYMERRNEWMLDEVTEVDTSNFKIRN